ncbi:saccharopine dehydrogenase NADP-binding domain-containing protein [Nocardia beijingensis]|uniref:NmrA family NAD(P)-binding protein n=1 Tax=Nocardia beijingensis TaxID=95162 RepID=UPI0033E4E6BC
MTSPEATATIAVYGATGHTGGYLLAELRRRGLTPILVGRNADRIRAAADAAAMPGAEIRVAHLSDRAALVRAFTGADVVISSLPAYVEHGSAVLDAAIDAGAHYTDMSGEQLFLKRVLDEYGTRDAAAGVTVVSGVTDSNLPGDLLAHLVTRRVTGPAEVVLSHLSKSGGNGSKGSAKTVFASLDWFRGGGWHYADGELRTGAAARHQKMTFPGDIEPTTVAKFPQPRCSPSPGTRMSPTSKASSPPPSSTRSAGSPPNSSTHCPTRPAPTCATTSSSTRSARTDARSAACSAAWTPTATRL